MEAGAGGFAAAGLDGGAGGFATAGLDGGAGGFATAGLDGGAGGFATAGLDAAGSGAGFAAAGAAAGTGEAFATADGFAAAGLAAADRFAAAGAAVVAGLLAARFAGLAAVAGFVAFAGAGFAGFPARGFVGFATVRFAAAFLRGVARPVGTTPLFAVAAAAFAARAGVRRAVADFGPPGAPGLGGLVPGVAGAGTVVSSSPWRSRAAASSPADTALRPSPSAESMKVRGETGIRAVCPQRETLCGERAGSVRRARGEDLGVAARERQRLGRREALPHRAAGRNPQRALDPPRERVEVEAQLQLVREEVLSSLPRCVHFGQYVRGRAGKEVVNKRGARHQAEVFRGWRGAYNPVIDVPRISTHGVETPSAQSPAGWRATKPAVERPSFAQRDPVTRCAPVSKRIPATSRNT